MRPPNDQYRTLILRVPLKVATTLAQLAAKENRDAEAIIEDLITKTYSPNLTPRQQQLRDQQEATERHRKLRLSSPNEAVSISDASEIERLVKLADKVRS